VPFSFSYLPYSETGSFSKLVTDYLAKNSLLRSFYQFDTDKEGMRQAIEMRKTFPVNRYLLTSVLHEQYGQLNTHEKTERNLQLLSEPNTFTVCTAHQPNLLTGYLYFVYKIIHAIKLAEELKANFQEYNFVPVYYMGSEDNDLEELGTFRYNQKKFVWDGGGQTGAVGRMKTESLKPLLDELFKELGPPGDACDRLQQLISEAYLHHSTIGSATQYLVNELFGRYGLIIIDPDNSELKSAYLPVMKDELLHQHANNVVSQQIAALSEHYKAQAHPRNINLFYLKDNLRERIEYAGGKWTVLNTEIEWTEAELLSELNEHPERFSPNVILRGLFQESILPNVAFIGGGAELAYWLQLKSLFGHYGVFFPALHLRQSLLFLPKKEQQTLLQLKLNVSEIFHSEPDIARQYVARHSSNDWHTDAEMALIEQALMQVQQKATNLDKTLKASSEAALAKIRRQMQVLEQKMLRAEKRNMEVQLSKISQLKKHLFPGNGLQERVENFISLYLLYGDEFFDAVMQGIEAFRHEFLVMEEAGQQA